MDVSLVYITIDSVSKARELGARLVEERLAACINILPGMTSIYRWQDKIETSEEVVVIAKTQTDLVDRLTQRVKSLHDYTIPCIIAIPIHGGNSDFQRWIYQETAYIKE
ncbi:MAG: divalent-cation tolerance protein CutA [Alphaproteobacteria bacterium]